MGQEANMSSDILFRIKTWLRLPINIFTFLFIIVFVIFHLTAYWESFLNYIDTLNAAIAVTDDLIVRIFGVAMLIVASIGFIRSELIRQESSVSYLAMAKVGAAAALASAAFFAGYPLDSLDNKSELLLHSKGKTTRPNLASGSEHPVLARWIQVVANNNCRLSEQYTSNDPIGICLPKVLIRAVVSRDYRCPIADIKYSEKPEVFSKLTLKPRKMGILNKRGSGFSNILVCEAEIHDIDHVSEILFSDRGFIKKSTGWDWSTGPERIAVLGDTGCRNNEKQTCSDGEWPFSKIATKITVDGADMVIHLGDYMYAGQEYDNWPSWQRYFFSPAKSLLESAPWVMVRGNHENCNHPKDGPLGFDLFFGQGPVSACIKSGENNDMDINDTYAIDLSENHRLIIADNSISFGKNRNVICYDKGANNTAINTVRILAKNNGDELSPDRCNNLRIAFDNVITLSRGSNKVWLAMHVPPFSLEWDEETDASNMPEYSETTAMMRKIWQENEKGLENIDVILSGDRHLFQALKAASKKPGTTKDRPFQVIVGTGGVNLDSIGGSYKQGVNNITPTKSGINHVSEPPSGGWLENKSVADKDTIESYRGFGYVMANGKNGAYTMTFCGLNNTCFFADKPGSKSLPTVDN